MISLPTTDVIKGHTISSWFDAPMPSDEKHQHSLLIQQSTRTENKNNAINTNKYLNPVLYLINTLW